MEKKLNLEKFLYWYKDKETTDSFIEPKDIYKRAWTSRDFELSHLWQRSIFLAVFLIAIAGAYGTIIEKMYFSGGGDVSRCKQHFIAFCLCWLGIAFSILWMMMSKGSKYWAEKYENLIFIFENRKAGANLKDCYHFGNMPKLERNKFNENIFSPLSGHYSVSKVNATIGIIGITVFSLLEMFHFAEFIHFRFESLVPLQYALFSISAWLGFGAILLVVLKFLCKSSIEDEKENVE